MGFVSAYSEVIPRRLTVNCNCKSFLIFSSKKKLIPVSIITNSSTHSKLLIKKTITAHVKFTPTCFGTQMEPSSGDQGLILAKVYIRIN